MIRLCPLQAGLLSPAGLLTVAVANWLNHVTPLVPHNKLEAEGTLVSSMLHAFSQHPRFCASGEWMVWLFVDLRVGANLTLQNAVATQAK